MNTATEIGVFDNLIDPPSTLSEIVGDVLRAAGLLSIIVALTVIGGTAIPLFALVLLGQLLPRFLGVRPALDITIGVVLLVAGWSNPLELYRAIPNWDLVMHFAANGLIGVIAFLLFVRLTAQGSPTGTRTKAVAIILTTAFGMATGVIWELGEWFGHTFLDDGIVVEYNDTLGDLAIGALGSLITGLAMPYLASQPKTERGAGLTGQPRKPASVLATGDDPRLRQSNT
jgi:hypothetical protein